MKPQTKKILIYSGITLTIGIVSAIIWATNSGNKNDVILDEEKDETNNSGGVSGSGSGSGTATNTNTGTQTNTSSVYIGKKLYAKNTLAVYNDKNMTDQDATIEKNKLIGTYLKTMPKVASRTVYEVARPNWYGAAEKKYIYKDNVL